MFKSIASDINREFRQGNMVTRLILINIAVFIFVNILWIIFNSINAGEPSPTYRAILHGLSISSDWWHNITHPWTPVTSMFLHEGFWHILWNMLYLYWFGRIIGDFIGDNKIFPLYLLGGLAGGLAFFTVSNFLPMFTADAYFAMGASGAVMAIVMASGVLAPDYQLRLLLIGSVKLKYVVAFILLMDLFFIANNVNTGGHFAHLGGAAFGWYFIHSLRHGSDLAKPINQATDRFLDWLYNRKRKKRPKFQTVRGGKVAAHQQGSSPSKPQRSADLQAQVDQILDKIRESGYDSLTEEEKEILFQASKEDS